MVVYWDLAALVNGAADYLLLLSAAPFTSAARSQ